MSATQAAVDRSWSRSKPEIIDVRIRQKRSNICLLSGVQTDGSKPTGEKKLGNGDAGVERAKKRNQ